MLVGLGNPGKKYDGTRHNVGFEALDAISSSWNIEVRRSRFEGLTGTGNVGGHKVLLLKPQTFMNLSGNSVRQAVSFYKLQPHQVLVFSDDIALAPGVLRIRKTGSAGGHNGLKSILSVIGDGFPRIRIGVGEKPHQEHDLADWVIGRFTADETKAVQARFEDVRHAAELIMNDRFDEAMSRYNGAGR